MKTKRSRRKNPFEADKPLRYELKQHGERSGVWMLYANQGPYRLKLSQYESTGEALADLKSRNLPKVIGLAGLVKAAGPSGKKRRAAARASKAMTATRKPRIVLPVTAKPRSRPTESIVEVTRRVGDITVVATARPGGRAFVSYKGVQGLSGSARYPDPDNVKGAIRQAGFLSSITKDEAVIARPTSGSPHWVKVSPGGLRALKAAKADVGAVVRASIEAAEAAERRSNQLLALSRALARAR